VAFFGGAQKVFGPFAPAPGPSGSRFQPSRPPGCFGSAKSRLGTFAVVGGHVGHVVDWPAYGKNQHPSPGSLNRTIPAGRLLPPLPGERGASAVVLPFSHGPGGFSLGGPRLGVFLGRAKLGGAASFFSLPRPWPRQSDQARTRAPFILSAGWQQPNEQPAPSSP